MKPKQKADPKQTFHVKRKRTISKFQMLINEGRHQLTIGHPETTFLMLSSFSDMPQSEKSKLHPDIKQNLAKKVSDLSQKQEEMIKTLLEIGQETVIEDKGEMQFWIEPPIHQTQRESVGLARNLFCLSKLIRKWYILTMKTEVI